MFPRILPYLFLIGGLISVIGVIYWKGQHDCKQSAIVKEQTHTIKDTETLNEIRNKRPTDVVLIDSLRNGSF